MIESGSVNSGSNEIRYCPWMIPKRTQRRKGKSMKEGNHELHAVNDPLTNQNQGSNQSTGSHFNALLGDKGNQEEIKETHNEGGSMGEGSN